MVSRPLIIFLTLTALAAGCQSKSDVARASRQRDTELARRENDRAVKHLAGGEYKDAEKALTSSLKADPTFGPARNNLGLVYYHTNRLYDAAWEFEHAIKLMPHQPEPRNNLGLVMERAGKLSVAADHYARARQMEPDNPQYIGNLARAKVRRGDRDPETRALLEELVLKDFRPEWQDWARMTLVHIPKPGQAIPSTIPAP